MRKTETSLWLSLNSKVPARTLQIVAVALGVGLVMSADLARAQDDDDDDDKTFEEKIIGNITAAICATNMENKGIDYRERSPLVVPPNLNLPPPGSASTEVNVPNWPKDPDEARRKKAVEARKKERKKDFYQEARPVSPAELNVARTAPGTSGGTRDSDSAAPGGMPQANPLSPSQLGFTGRVI